MDLEDESNSIREQIESLQLPDGFLLSRRETSVSHPDLTAPPEYLHRFDCGPTEGQSETIVVRVSERGVDVLYCDRGNSNVQMLGCADRVKTAIEDILKYLRVKYNSAVRQKE